MEKNFRIALKHVLEHEGGFVNHPADPGGATNKGVTLATYRGWIGRNVGENDLRNIPENHVKAIYRENYWNKIKGDDLPSGVDYCVFDFAVNSGPKRAAQFLQRVVNVDDDGVIGPQTLAAVNKITPVSLIVNLNKRRLDWLQGLRTWRTFGRGWTNRVKDQESKALVMAGGSTDAVSPEPRPPSRPPRPDRSNAVDAGIGVAGAGGAAAISQQSITIAIILLVVTAGIIVGRRYFGRQK